MLVDLRKFDISGKLLETELDEVHITANKNTVPEDPKGPTQTSGLRLGSPAVTTRGFNEDDMCEVGALVGMAIFDFEKNKSEIADRVDVLCKKYPIYED